MAAGGGVRGGLLSGTAGRVDTDLIMAIIKLVEDKMNAEEDITDGGVQAILLVEDSIKNKVKLKYGTFVYLVNGKEKRK